VVSPAELVVDVEAEVVIRGGDCDGEPAQLEAVVVGGDGMLARGEDDERRLLCSKAHPRLYAPRVKVGESCVELEGVSLFEVSSGHSVGCEGVGPDGSVIREE
jgi:hypothetical protein